MINYYMQRLMPMPKMRLSSSSLEMHGAAYNCINNTLAKNDLTSDLHFMLGRNLPAKERPHRGGAK